ncbi:MAG: ABC transporter substrate-binding protein, partial [Chloroflexota bacterium]
GPFKFKSWNRGVSVEVQRYDGYFRKGLPYLDGIRWLIIPESTTQIAALRTGRVVFSGVGSRGLFASDVRVLQKEMPQLKIIPHGSTNWYELAFNMTRKPYNDVRVRRAIMMVLTQQKFIDLASDGAGFRGGHMPPDGSWSLPADELKAFPPVRGATPDDIAKAKSLLAEAGYPNGFTTTFVVRKGTLYEDQGVVMIDQLRTLNITGAVRPVDHPVGYFDVVGRGDFDIVVGVPIPAFNDPDAYLKNYVTADPGNIFRYSSPDIDKLFRDQTTEVDAGKRRQLAWDMQRKLWQDLPSVPLYHIQYFHAFWPQVRGWTGPGMVRENLKMEGVWLAK